jgi:hypothetical protein
MSIQRFSLALSVLASPVALAAEVPPQFVILAYDGSKSLKMWEDTRAFASTVNARFTYFINTPYFALKSKATSYTEPARGPGKICITWGDVITPNNTQEAWRVEEIAVEQQFTGPERVLERMRLMNRAYSEGHEIAVHGVSHCPGDVFSQKQWEQEFTQFFAMLFKYIPRNDLQSLAGPEHQPAFDRKEVVGFRAPELAVSKGLWPTLQKEGIRYDTSLDGEPNVWPRRNSTGTWSFALGNIPVAGTPKRTLSMDYNFYMIQSHGEPVRDPQVIQAIEEQMYASYMNYFWSNYLGNRAPIHIGHHFSRWNEGAYWRAFQRFAQDVCVRPDVRCATYADLLKFVEANEAKLPIYQKSNYKNEAREPASLGKEYDMAMGLKYSGKTFKADLGGIYVVSQGEKGGRSLASTPAADGLRWTFGGIELRQARGKSSLQAKELNKLLATVGAKEGFLQAAYYRNPGDKLSFQSRTVHVRKTGADLKVSSQTVEEAALRYEGGAAFGLHAHE